MDTNVRRVYWVLWNGDSDPETIEVEHPRDAASVTILDLIEQQEKREVDDFWPYYSADWLVEVIADNRSPLSSVVAGALRIQGDGDLGNTARYMSDWQTKQVIGLVRNGRMSPSPQGWEGFLAYVTQRESNRRQHR